MATQKQIDANRQNAQKSTGPKTSKGKSVAAQNSLKHGMFTGQIIINGESQDEFELHRNRLFEQFKPSDPLEEIYVGRIVTHSWLLKRSIRFQTAVINSLHHSHRNKPVIKLPGILRPKKDDSPPPPDLELGDVAVKDFANAKVLDNLIKHERRIENSLYKAILEMQRKQLIKKIDAENEK
ncbi:MAG TPA: hypothetical protein ENH94_07075 [Phycisphaerales bacterium]|nr:hypothetical protein [Phycisphaerales bacterium]